MNKVTYHYQPNVTKEDRDYLHYLWIAHNLAGILVLNMPEEVKVFFDEKIEARQEQFYIYYRNHPDDDLGVIRLRYGSFAIYLDTMVKRLEDAGVDVHDPRVILVVGNEWGVDVDHLKAINTAITYAEDHNVAIAFGSWGVGGWDQYKMSQEVKDLLLAVYQRAVESPAVVHEAAHEYMFQRDPQFVGKWGGNDVNFDPMSGNLWLIGRYIWRWNWLLENGVTSRLPVAILEGGYDDTLYSWAKGHREDIYDSNSAQIPAGTMYEHIKFLMDNVYDVNDPSHAYYIPSKSVTIYAQYCYGNGGMGTYGEGDWRQFNYASDWGSRHNHAPRTEYFKLLEENYYGTGVKMEKTLTVLVENLNIRSDPTTASALIGQLHKGVYDVEAHSLVIVSEKEKWVEITVGNFDHVWVALTYNGVTLATVNAFEEDGIAQVQLETVIENLQKVVDELVVCKEGLKYLLSAISKALAEIANGS